MSQSLHHSKSKDFNSSFSKTGTFQAIQIVAIIEAATK
jgi:hypothetical protein